MEVYLIDYSLLMGDSKIDVVSKTSSLKQLKLRKDRCLLSVVLIFDRFIGEWYKGIS